VQGESITDQYLIPFAEFGAVNFSSIAAIEIYINASFNVDFVMDALITYGSVVIIPTEDAITGSVLPCDMDYYRIEKLSNLTAGDYLRIYFNQTGEPDHADSLGTIYIVSSIYEDLQTELELNTNILDTLGQLPGPNNYLYSCSASECEIEITSCQLEELTYYIGIEGSDSGVLLYQFSVYLNEVPVFPIYDRTPQPVLFDRRPTVPPTDHIYHYRYFEIDIPEAIFSEGTYLVVNISRAQPIDGLELLLNYGGLPEFAADTGVIEPYDYNSQGERSDDCIYDYCVDTSRTPDEPFYVHPVRSQSRMPCYCHTEVEKIGAGPNFQLTCKLTVDPCHFQYGKWYASVLLPVRSEPENPDDTSGYCNYTITAYVIQPDIVTLEKNDTVKGFIWPELSNHYSLTVPVSDYIIGQTHLFVQVSNVRNGIIDIWVHQNTDGAQNLAGGPEGCAPANITCKTSAACNLVVEKCHFAPGTWFIGVSIAYADEDEQTFEIIDWSKLPITYTLRATWTEDSAPVPIVAGVPTFGYIGEALYDFYVIDIPPTIDTWLYIELYAKSSTCNTGVILSVLHGALPGGECYHQPDFYCLTGEPRNLDYTAMDPQRYFSEPPASQTCSFIIQTCELQTGPLYFSVYGHHMDYFLYGDNTYYQLPVEYTLYVDFDTALAVQSGVAYSETVFENQYQHYYIRSDYLQEGSYLSVEVCNIQHAIPQSLEVFVNYNYLAGACPCYEHLYNATGAFDATVVPLPPTNDPSIIPELDTVDTCATILVPPGAYRSGIWYIGILGMNQNLNEFATPIGYTLTVTVHDAPVMNPLILGQSEAGVAPRWNRTLEYTHYKLAAQPLPNNDLVFKLTYVQNCESYQPNGKHNNILDELIMYVAKGAVASDGYYQYSCVANVATDSFCTIVVPHCEWVGNDYFIAIKGDYDADFDGRYTIRAYTDEVRDYALTSGVSVTDRVSQGLYKHYFLDVQGGEHEIHTEYLYVFFYSNDNRDPVSVFLNYESRAGVEPCYTNMASCLDSSCCTLQVENYLLQNGKYYVSVYGGEQQFYDTPVEYTLSVSTKPVVTMLSSGDPLTGSVEVGEIQHYLLKVTDKMVDQTAGYYLVFNVEVGCSHGSILAYYNYGTLAGRVPGYLHLDSCYADDFSKWCEIRVPVCEFKTGDYFFSIRGDAYTTGDVPFYSTAIGYTLEVNVVAPDVVVPVVDVGRFPVTTEYNQFVANEHLIHYEFTVTQADLDAGYHWIVEITNVDGGALSVYYNPGTPADQDCHLAQICTSGLSTGRTCHWQIPYSTIRATEELHYISIYAISGRFEASFDILIWKQPVPSLFENPDFTLTGIASSAEFPFGTELNITHLVQHEPTNWVQFIKLANVPAHDDPGFQLQIFFYRIVNNLNNPRSFNVYLYPSEPAGAHECCDSDPGSCHGLPTQRTVDLSTNNFRPDVDMPIFTCAIQPGTGIDPTNTSSFYGERCTVTVWPCELAKYCQGETLDWWLTIVPIAPSYSITPLNGLSYSVQWRLHNIRLAEKNDVGTISLDQWVNVYDYSTDFAVAVTTPENEGWRSFSLTVPDFPNRLVIQTYFFAPGQGEVYIQGGNFASPLYDYHCSSYLCTTDMDCAGSDRFIASDCVYGAYDIYYITVRNTGNVGDNLAFGFRITAVPTDTEVTIIPQGPTEDNKFVGSADFITDIGIFGLEGEAYDFYVLSIDDHDLDFFESLIVDLQLIEFFDTYAELDVYIRLGAPAGDFYGGYDLYYNDDVPEGCYTYQFTCHVSSENTRCTIQIPHSDLVQGHWYISVFNPIFDYGPGPTEDLPNYNLTVFLQDVIPLTLNTAFIQDNANLSNLYPGTYTHFYINITQGDILYDTRTDLEGFYTSWLRFRLTGYNPNRTIEVYENGANYTYYPYDFYNFNARMYVAYGNLAGDPFVYDYDIYTLEYIERVNCDNFNEEFCYIDILPCPIYEDHYLRSGMYFVALYLEGNTTYNLTVTIENESYDSISPEVEQGSGSREGTTNTYWRHTVTQAELDAEDNDGYYRYVIDSTASLSSDDVDDNFYYLVNITTEGNAYDAIGFVDLLVWRDDCSEFVCAAFGADDFCVIDALTTAPCSIKGGRFYFKVFNPLGLNFTLTFYANETTVQRLYDQQVITEIVYPDEYQEYFYEAVDVGEGATLTVRVCSICGSVEAWIRPDLPAGPTFDQDTLQPGPTYDETCSIDHCIVDERYYADVSFDDDDFHCCMMFLDTCQYDQRGYYIAVRGVGTLFPDVFYNEHLYLPAKYQIQAVQTNVQVTDAPFTCLQTVVYQHPEDEVPQQFAFDLESINVGGMLRFSLAIPYTLANNYFYYFNTADLYVSRNSTAGFTSSCDAEFHCEIFNFESGFDFPYYYDEPHTVCHVIVENAQPGRYYAWADAPRGSIVLAERWDPYIPLIQENVYISGSVNALNTFETPYAPALQYYRFDYGPEDDEDLLSFYDKFFIRAETVSAQNGVVSFTVSYGNYPGEFYLGDCSSDSSFGCYVDIDVEDVYADSGDDDDEDEGYYQCYGHSHQERVRNFWITVEGTFQECELHSIEYTFIVRTSWEIDFLPVGKVITNSVPVDGYNFYRLNPHSTVSPQQTYLHFEVFDFGNAFMEVEISDNFMASFWVYDDYFGNFGFDDGISFDWFCGYDNLFASVYAYDNGDFFSNAPVNYAMKVTEMTYPVKELFQEKVYHSDDDDDDMCPHPNDIYYFKAVAPNGNPASSFLRVGVDSEFPIQVYINKDSFAAPLCHIAYGATSVRGTLNVYDFCQYSDGVYYITVVSEGPYKIYAAVVDEATPLTLGEVYRDSLESSQYHVYTLEICDDWLRPDDRLVVEIADIEYGDVYGWIQKDRTPGPYNSDRGSCVCDIDGSSAISYFGAEESGYSFLLVDHADLTAGTYHILIRAEPSDDDYDNLDDDENYQNPHRTRVQYRLFPYLADFDIEPTVLEPNTFVQSVVDFWAIDRFTDGSVPMVQYFEVAPLTEGHINGVSFGQVLIGDVTGGLLGVRVLSGRLAAPQYAIAYDRTTGLTQDYTYNIPDHNPSNMQSGKFPWNVVPIMDDRYSPYQEGCTGAADFCAFMSTDADSDQYLTDTSVALWVSSCYYQTTENLYIAVSAEHQYYLDQSIDFSIEFQQYVDFILLRPDFHIENGMADNNWEHHFYRSLQATVESARWRVVVTEGEGVLVTVRNHRCPLQATWSRQVWCDNDYFNQGHNYMCDIEIPTAASHPGDNVFFVDVYGKNASYSIAYWRGIENCHQFTGSGARDGVQFCSDVVSYATWRWEDYTALDMEAECFFNDLYNHFRVQPCWSGVTTDCNSTLRQFACYESFRACDAAGFYVGTCRSACDAVVYECVNMFETVNLEHYNCTSNRYIDEEAYYCTGYGAYPVMTGPQTFFPDVPNIEYNGKYDEFIPQYIHEIPF